MSDTKVTTFRFTPEELEILGVIEGHTGIRSRTEALRGVLKEHAHPGGTEDASRGGSTAASPGATNPETPKD